jgi:2-phospho-L-lactate guanylyltransferase
MFDELNDSLVEDGIYAVIPIKEIADAKQRLRDTLNSDERRGLFRAMLQDVLAAAESCSGIDGIIVVTDDPEVRELGARYGALILPEPAERGLIPAVTAAARLLADAGASTLVFLPGDVPLVHATELDIVLAGIEGSGEREMVIVPASDLGGSNCVACSPPDCMRFAFGVDSYRKHLAIAEELSVQTRALMLPGLGLDIDTASDLRELALRQKNLLQKNLPQNSGGGNTHRFLCGSGALEKITNKVSNAG